MISSSSPPIPLSQQGEAQSFLKMAAIKVERSIAGGEECSIPQSIYYRPSELATMPQQFLYWCMHKISYVLETYNIRKLEPYRGPAVVPRTRVVYQGGCQTNFC